MTSASAFTFRDMVVTLLVVLLFSVFLLVLIRENSLPPSRTVCSNNLKGIHQAMSTYAVTNSDRFPYAGRRDLSRDVQGVEGRMLRALQTTTMPPDQSAYVNNATAALWMLVRDGSISPRQLTCDKAKGDEPDPLTLDGTRRGRKAPLNQTWDVFAAKNISYTTINMYRHGSELQWNASVSANWVVLSDDNDNDSTGDRHAYSKDGKGGRNARGKGPTADEKQRYENSTNHSGEGQNFMFGDGHAQFESDPFQGPNNDNVFADDEAETIDQPERPRPLASLRNDTPLTPVERNIVLLSIEGNGGVNLSR